MTKPELSSSPSVLRHSDFGHSFVIRHSDFVISHPCKHTS